MTHQNRRLLAAGLLAGAIVLPAIGSGASPDEPGRAEPDSPAKEARAAVRYLLLTDGRLIPGVISHDDTTYTVTQKIGALHYPRKKVERSFDTIRQAYEYRLARLPEDDPAERIALARWCLNLHMTVEAREQLEKVVEISPKHSQAQAMLIKLAQSEASRATRGDSKIDPAVQLSSGEEVVEDRAGALDSSVYRGAARELGITGAPVIFDLPPTLAQRRAEQFKHYVHPVLQAYCAKCHNNATYEGQFQLIPAATAKQRTPDVLRANLDATLGLIDPESLAKSELLSSTLRPHGVGGRKRPIFPGSNNRAYQILSTWVSSLDAGHAVDAPRRRMLPEGAEPAEDFATERRAAGPLPIEDVARGAKPAARRRSAADGIPGDEDAHQSYRFLEGQGMVPEESGPADPKEFPLPYVLGGQRPTDPRRGAGKSAPLQQPGATRGLAGEVDPAAVRAAMAAAAEEAGKAGRDDPDSAAATKGTTPAKKKRVKLDPAILERMLQQNPGRPAGP
jgi:hypothetical protein